MEEALGHDVVLGASEIAGAVAVKVTSEARVAVVAEEASVGLAADLVGAAGEVVRGGAPVTSVEGAELIAGEGGRAAFNDRWRRRRCIATATSE